MDSTLTALADPRRRALVELLLTGEKPVGDLVRQLPIAQSGVSRHLRVLKDAGLVTSRQDGQRRLYALSAAPFRELSAWVAQYRRLWEARLDQFEAELAKRTHNGAPGPPGDTTGA
jgi:DNA-binding transcriptional ArsR family regulator